MRVRVPRDCATLADALATGADRIVLQGVVELPAGGAGAIVDRPVQITGGTLRGQGGWALLIGADVVLADTRIENPDGHGVRIVAGAPTLSNVELSVGGVAGVCEGTSRPVLRRVVVTDAENGWLLREDSAPDGDELAVKATGSALVVTDRAAGHLARVALVSGDTFACVEGRGQATTQLAGLTVLSAGCGALHFFEDCAVTVDGGHIQESGTSGTRFPAVETRERAAPTLRDLRVDNSGGRGFFVHGEARPVLRSVAVSGCGGAGMEVQGGVVLDVSGLSVSEAAGAGVVVRGEVTGRLDELRTDRTSNAGLAIGGSARLQVDGVEVRDAEGIGMRVAGTARATVRKLNIELLGGLGVQVHESSALTLVEPSIRLGRFDGVHVCDTARLILRGGRVGDHYGRGVVASDRSRVRIERTQLSGNGGWQLLAQDAAEVRLVDCVPDGATKCQDEATLLEGAASAGSAT